MSDQLLTRAEVERRTGFKRSAIYKRIAAGTFPQPQRFKDTRAVRWRASDIVKWKEEQGVV